MERVFRDIQKHLKPRHEATCNYRDSLKPVKQCNCTCFEKWWFRQGINEGESHADSNQTL